jgi:hypothetical protein
MSVYIDRFRELSRRTQAGLSALLLTFAAVAPVLVSGTASAAPSLTERELQSTSAIAGGATDLTFLFDTTADAGQVERIEIEFCDSPLGACTVPDGSSNAAADNIPILPGSPTAVIGGPGGWAAPANSATRVAGEGGGTANQIDIDVTTAFAGASANEASVAITGFTNDNDANVSYYTRVRVYSNDLGTDASLQWEGVFAQSTAQTLTVNARVQERLDFCVGSTTSNNATTSVGAACINVTGTTVNLGNVEGSNVNVTPVTATNGGDATPTNGVAMVRTNAVNGVVVDYKALLDTSSGALKVPGATCNAVPSTDGTDQCFNTNATQGAFSPATEMFGMTIAGINCGSTTAYACNFTNDLYNLRRDAEYDGNGTTGAGSTTFVTDTDTVAGTTNGGYAWQASGAADRIASSTGSTVKVVDDEAMILKFAATAGITTPTGSYTVQADFIATTTF